MSLPKKEGGTLIYLLGATSLAESIGASLELE